MRETTGSGSMREKARRREKVLRDSRAELNFARQGGIAEGRAELKNELIVKMRQKGLTDEQIAEYFD